MPVFGGFRGGRGRGGSSGPSPSHQGLSVGGNQGFGNPNQTPSSDEGSSSSSSGKPSSNNDNDNNNDQNSDSNNSNRRPDLEIPDLGSGSSTTTTTDSSPARATSSPKPGSFGSLSGSTAPVTSPQAKISNSTSTPGSLIPRYLPILIGLGIAVFIWIMLGCWAYNCGCKGRRLKKPVYEEDPDSKYDRDSESYSLKEPKFPIMGVSGDSNFFYRRVEEFEI